MKALNLMLFTTGIFTSIAISAEETKSNGNHIPYFGYELNSGMHDNFNIGYRYEENDIIYDANAGYFYYGCPDAHVHGLKMGGNLFHNLKK